jgi:predicted ATPase/DNA-binding XRE family transcriptional regulator/Tfp pilus assembly protein PilF
MSAPQALSLSALLRRFRVAAGLTQDELAQRARVSVRAVSDLERGVRRAPHKDTLTLLMEALSLNESDRDLLAEAARRSRRASIPPSTAALRTGAPPHAIPAALTPLIGRDREEEAIMHLLARADVRLLTLTGPAGIGKTRLAQHVAENLRERYAGGVALVSLAPLTEHTSVLPAIAQALGIQEQAGQSTYDQVKAYLAGRELLLVLDNFEHVARAAAVVAEMLASCPKVKALVTSRAPLRVRGEQEFAIPPLDTPDVAHLPLLRDLSQYAAVTLFVCRAQAVKPSFALTHDLAPTVAAICARMDGLPLALELAAARIKLLSPQALLARLDSGLAILTNGPADLPQRQQTMRRAIEWSYDLLDESEQRFFRQLAVFSGGWTLEAAEAICIGGNGHALDALASLVDKSLVTQEEDAEGEPRFRLLELIRAYGWELLADRDEGRPLRGRHASFYLGLAEKAERELHGGEQIAWFNRLAREHANLHAALHWAEESGDVQMGLRLSGALWWFWQVRGHLSAGRAWLERFLALQESADGERNATLRARALEGAGNLAWRQGDVGPAAAFLDASLGLYRGLQERRGMAHVLNTLGLVADGRGDYAQASSLFEESLALWREVRDVTFIAGVLNNLAMVAYHQERYARASELYEESLALHRAADDHWSIALTLSNLGEVSRAQGDLVRAATLLEQSVALYADLDDKEGLAFALCNSGDVAREQGDMERAAQLYGRSIDIGVAREAGSPMSAVSSVDGAAEVAYACGDAVEATRLFALATELREKYQSRRSASQDAQRASKIAALRVALGDDAFTTEWAEGRTMSLEESLSLLGHGRT